MAQLPSSGKGSKAVNPNADALQCTRQMQQTVWRGFAAAALRIRLSNSHSAVVIAGHSRSKNGVLANAYAGNPSCRPKKDGCPDQVRA
ncbi:MAG: hypothetical protein ACOY4O_06555 [Pseudomonadota bacterium]